MTKSRNRKLICVTSSNESLKHMCVDLCDYNRCFNQIWHRTQIPHYQHVRIAKFTQTEIPRWRWPPSKDGGVRHLGFRNMSVLDRIFAQNLVGRCIAEMTFDQNSKPQLCVTSLNECREHRCDDVKVYKSCQLTDLYLKPMENSPVRAIV